MTIIEYIKNINFKTYSNVNPEEIEDNFVSELHMHKILYFLYAGFYKNFNKELFSPNFEAWKFGPVDINYRKFLKNNEKLPSSYNLDLSKLSSEEKNILMNCY